MAERTSSPQRLSSGTDEGRGPEREFADTDSPGKMAVKWK